MSRFNEIVKSIRESDHWYDHRPFLPPEAMEKWGTAEVQCDYAAFKHSVAMMIAPASIVEIGVGYGIAARAFLSAVPKATYVGYDNGADGEAVIQHAKGILRAGFPYARVEMIDDSLHMTNLPRCDLCHVDGAHDFEHAYRDVKLALASAAWTLVDDTRDSQVAAATMQAVYDWRPGDVEWASFEDTWKGNILIYTGRK